MRIPKKMHLRAGFGVIEGACQADYRAHDVADTAAVLRPKENWRKSLPSRGESGGQRQKIGVVSQHDSLVLKSFGEQFIVGRSFTSSILYGDDIHSAHPECLDNRGMNMFVGIGFQHPLSLFRLNIMHQIRMRFPKLRYEPFLRSNGLLDLLVMIFIIG